MRLDLSKKKQECDQNAMEMRKILQEKEMIQQDLQHAQAKYQNMEAQVKIFFHKEAIRH